MLRLRRWGVTLVELMVVLTILGVVFGLVGIGIAGLRPPPSAGFQQRLESGREAAIIRGVDVLVTAADSSDVVRFRPDGQTIGTGVDPLNGAVSDATRE